MERGILENKDIKIIVDDKSNKNQVRALWELAFREDTKSFLDFYFEYVFDA